MESATIISIALGILAVIFAILIIKHLFRIALFLLVLVAIYAAYLYQSGQKIPQTKTEIIEHGEKKFDQLRDQGDKIINEIKK